MNKDATFKQKFLLYKLTGEKIPPNKFTLETASSIISAFLEYKKTRETTEALKIAVEWMKKINPEWDLDRLNLDYVPMKGKRGSEKTPKQEELEGEGPEIQPGEDAPEPPRTPIEPLPDEPEEKPEIQPSGPMPDMPGQPEEPDPSEVDKKIKELIEAVKREKKELEENIPEIEPKNKEYIKPDIWDEVYKLVKAGQNVLIFGPAGCGKSRLAQEIAHTLDANFFTISFSGGLRYSQVYGSTHIKDGNSEWVPSAFIKAIQEPGLILLDELCSCDAEVAKGINAITEPNSRSWLSPNGRVKVHEGVKFIACDNTSGRQINRQYTGSQRQDDSTLDRFPLTFHMNYDPTVEKQIVKAFGIKSADSIKLLKKLENLRAKVKELDIPFDPSTRRLIACCRAIKVGFTLDRAFELSFLTSLSKAERQKISNV